MTDVDARAEAARADFCRFLAACYYEPDASFAEEGLFESMAVVGECFDPAMAEGARQLGEAFSASSLEELLVDYTRLFLGPVDARARPYGSAWLGPDGLTMQDSTMDLLALYEQGGFEIAEDFRELPDHVAAELEFLYLLLFREDSARSDGNAAALAEASALRGRFMAEHLGRWAGPFTQAVEREAGTAFYRTLGRLAGRFLQVEAQRAGACHEDA